MKKIYIHLLVSLVCVTMLSFGIMTATSIPTSALTYQTTTDVEFTVNPSINVSLSSNDLLISDLTPGTSSDSNIITVDVSTNAGYGYYLAATAGTSSGSTNLVNTADNSRVFTNLSSNKASLSNFSDNTWGYSYSTDNGTSWISGNNDAATAGYNGLPLDNNDNGVTGIQLASTDSYVSTNSIKFKIGAKASTTQSGGTYTNTVNFYAVANPEPLNINNIVYMQEFATLNSTDKTAVLNSMTFDAQYQLKDNRDNKTYYVSKLKDGRVWMTQNLDHDIVTTANYYTNTNTDIGWNDLTSSYDSATWTAETATYSSDSPDWQEYSYSILTYNEESYDPGIKYWSGSIDDDTLLDNGNPHYNLGNYYNWAAASAVDTVGDSTGFLNQSICPSGWTLPYGSYENSDFYSMFSEYDLETHLSNDNYNAWEAAIYVIPAGRYAFDSSAHHPVLELQGSMGYMWSSYKENGYPYSLFLDFSSGVNLDVGDDSNPSVGLTIRCVAR